ncbi:MAG: hypothetical protein QXH07_06785 [Thermoplasmata archaeon]
MKRYLNMYAVIYECDEMNMRQIKNTQLKTMHYSGNAANTQIFNNVFKAIKIHNSRYLLIPKSISNKIPNQEIFGQIEEDKKYIYIILQKNDSSECSKDLV